MSTAWEKTQEQYERKMERQRKLEELERVGTTSPYTAPSAPNLMSNVEGVSIPNLHMDSSTTTAAATTTTATATTTAPAITLSPAPNAGSLHSSRGNTTPVGGGGGNLLPSGSSSTGGIGSGNVSSASSAASNTTGTNTSSAVPKGAIENARRFLWDEDEEDYATPHHHHHHANSIPSTAANTAPMGMSSLSSAPPSYYSTRGSHHYNDAELFKGANTTINLSPSVAKNNQRAQQQQQQQHHAQSGSNNNMSPGIKANLTNLVWGVTPKSSDSASHSQRSSSKKKLRMGSNDVRQASFILNDADTAHYESEEYLGRHNHLPKRRYSPLQNCFFIVVDNIYEFFLRICDYCGYLLYSCSSCASAHARFCVACFSMLLVIVAVVVVSVIMSTRAANNGGGSIFSSSNPSSPTGHEIRPVRDTVRFHAIRDMLEKNTFITNTSELDEAGTPLNLALRWMTDDDPSQLMLDDDSFMQRYVLAVLYFATYNHNPLPSSSGNNPTRHRGRRLQQQQQDQDMEAGWVDEDHWMSNKGICAWAGVYCSPHLRDGVEEIQYNDNSYVLKLNLTFNNLRGTIPEVLGALENLESLDLGQNRLSGTIPSMLCSIRHLREYKNLLCVCVCVLPFCHRVGSCWFCQRCTWFCRRGGVEFVIFIQHTLTHTKYFAQTGELYLEENDLTGGLPSELGLMTAMRDLFLGTNAIQGSIPTEVSRMGELRALALDDNRLNGTIPYLGNLTNMSE